MYLSNDRYIGRGLDKYGESHFHEIQLLKQLVSKGDVFIDVGANMGVITVPLAQAVGKNGYVMSIEAQPFLFNILCGNLALNELHQAQAVNRAVANISGQVAYMPDVDYREENSFGSLFASQTPPADKKCRPVSTISLDDMGLNPRLIKIDVEGMELPVLEGSRKVIERCRPILYVEFLGEEVELVKFMKSIDYDFKIHEPPLFNEANFASDPEDIFISENGNPIVSIDLVCWHKDTELGADGHFLYDVMNSPFERHDPIKALKEQIYQ